MAGTGVDIDRTAMGVMDTTHTGTPMAGTRTMWHILATMVRDIMGSLIITSARTTGTMSVITARGRTTTPTIDTGGIITTITTTVGVTATIGAGVGGTGTGAASMWLVRAS
jgi:hypothetical protein